MLHFGRNDNLFLTIIIIKIIEAKWSHEYVIAVVASVEFACAYHYHCTRLCIINPVIETVFFEGVIAVWRLGDFGPQLTWVAIDR